MRRINLDKVKELIDEFSLKDACRENYYTWNRFEIFHALRQLHYTFQRIGNLFNKDHATVRYGIIQRELLINHSDYQIETEQIRARLELCYEDSPIEYSNVSNLEKQIINAQCLAEFLFIKGQLLNEIKRR